MKRTLFIFGLSLVFSTTVFAQFYLPALPYGYDALEPFIDSNTMYIHYNNHHAAYVKNLNDALKDFPTLQSMDIVELIRDIDSLPAEVQTAVRNNGGGHYNHSFFWTVLAPAGTTKISDKLRTELEKNFGSVENFKSEFEKAATGRFGSGWAWLIKEPDGKLKIVSTPNQDNPLMFLAEQQGTPILGLDVWEHAYYLKYQSKRADYAKAFWNVVNWNEVEKRLGL